jgi:disulfide bond formation protein DsbB
LNRSSGVWLRTLPGVADIGRQPAPNRWFLPRHRLAKHIAVNGHASTALPARDRRLAHRETNVTIDATANTSSARNDAHPALIAALAITAIAAATLAGAWFFQLVLDIRPCPLCLEQRYAYYLVVPLGALTALLAGRDAPRGVLLAGLAILWVAALGNAVLGTYHAGVEWQFWQGPTDCTGPIGNLGSAGSLLERLDTVKVIRCDEVQWRFLGLSLAGYNVLISLLMAAIAVWGIVKLRRS